MEWNEKVAQFRIYQIMFTDKGKIWLKHGSIKPNANWLNENC
jgi:hypothetical protein